MTIQVNHNLRSNSPLRVVIDFLHHGRKMYPTIIRWHLTSYHGVIPPLPPRTETKVETIPRTSKEECTPLVKKEHISVFLVRINRSICELQNSNHSHTVFCEIQYLTTRKGNGSIRFSTKTPISFHRNNRHIRSTILYLVIPHLRIHLKTHHKLTILVNIPPFRSPLPSTVNRQIRRTVTDTAIYGRIKIIITRHPR